MRLQDAVGPLVLIYLLQGCGGEAPVPAQSSGPLPETPVLSEAPPPFSLSEEQAKGKVVYETVCWSCHGSAGRGDGPAVQAGSVTRPRDFQASPVSSAEVRRMEAAFRATTSSLEPNHPHMANVLGLMDEEAFVAALAYLPALSYPPEIPGSAVAGHTTYVLRCQGCHGASGKGDGPAAATLHVRPADFTQDTLLASRNFQGAFEKIRQGGGGVHGSSMPAWGVMLKDGDVWDLVAYIGTFQPGVFSPPPGGSR